MAANSSSEAPVIDMEKNTEKGEDGEFENTRGKSNKQVVEDNWKQLYAQEENLNVVSENAQEANELAKDFNDEAKKQTKMINNMNDHMDKTNADMI